MLLITAVSLAVVALLVAGMMKILSENKSLTLAKIGVSIPEDEAVTAVYPEILVLRFGKEHLRIRVYGRGAGYKGV